MPSNASRTTASGSLMSFFTALPLLVEGDRNVSATPVAGQSETSDSLIGRLPVVGPWPHAPRDARVPVLRPSAGSRRVLRGLRAQSRGGRAPPDGERADRRPGAREIDRGDDAREPA